MDENYLDNLLNEISLDKDMEQNIEEELDSQLQEEKLIKQQEQAVSEEDLFNADLKKDADMVYEQDDLHFSEDQMNELDELDHLADLDIGDIDFDDIDFDDLDVTKLTDVSDSDFDEVLKEFDGDLEIKDYSEQNDHNELHELEEDSEKFDTEEFLDSLLDESLMNEDEPIVEMQEDSSLDADKDHSKVIEEKDTTSEENEEELESLDSMLNQIDATFEDGELKNQVQESVAEEQDLSKKDNSDLDDLFAMLNLDDEYDEDHQEKENHEDIQMTNDFENLDQEEVLDDISIILDQPKQKKKRTFMEILFGEPDDDELSEEEIALLEAKKEEKKAKKKAAKQQKKENAEKKKAAKELKNGVKQKENELKKQLKAETRAKNKAEELAMLQKEKKLNTSVVIFIFTLFLGGIFLLYLVTTNFNYSQVIEKATHYFANQKYRKAYDEIVGVEVKEEDQDLKDRIYTVMYVERLYESYQNNIKLDRQEKALDALLRGVSKYYEHKDEANELGIMSDLDYSFNQIKEVLFNQYGITIEMAIELNALENYEYVQKIDEYVANQNASNQKELQIQNEKLDAIKPDDEDE